jgi:hypothetical protein
MTAPGERPVDILIVGGGTAGCVLQVARPSALSCASSPSKRPGIPPGREPADIRDPTRSRMAT